MLCYFVLQGMTSGFADDEAYNVYDKPWRHDQSIASNIYRPSRNITDKDVYGDDLDTLMNSKRSETNLCYIKSSMFHICPCSFAHHLNKIVVFIS